MGEYLAFLSKTTIQKVCSNKMKQETKLEKLGIYSNRIIYLQHQACISRLFGAQYTSPNV
ncbi:hypothetical protein AS202_18715 [Myroides odoratimimus]|uniref:Uncharacterized protein n=1 Tax=Myroides odoratimimus TaxID=76832 RepID=A0AAI8C6U6_9FLAO|nr:hypothetical protein AS202_18715 [Myroides odoratimimus]